MHTLVVYKPTSNGYYLYHTAVAVVRILLYDTLYR